MKKNKLEILGLIRTKKFRVFSLFFLVATVFWMLSKLNSDYKTKLDFPVVFNNIPNEKSLNAQDVKLKLAVEASGYQLLKTILNPSKVQVDVTTDIKDGVNGHYWLPSSFKNKIENNLPDGLFVRDVITDTVYVDVFTYDKKKLPVLLEEQIDFIDGYAIKGKIVVTPNIVTVFGPKKILDSLEHIQTEALVLQELNKSFDGELSLVNVKNTLKFSKNEVQVQFEVDQFVTGEMIVPIEMLNVPDDITVTIFPKNAKISYKAPLSIYNELDDSDFKVTCDFNAKSEANIKLVIDKMPDLLQDIKLKQRSVAYLVKK